MAFEIAGTLALIIVSYITYVIAQWAIKRREIHKIFVKYGIPGPKPNFLDGNMNELKAGPTPNDVITKWLNKYGPMFGYYIGDMAYLVVKDLEILKRVLIKDFSNFTDRSRFLMEGKPSSDTLIAQQGQKWKSVRNISTPMYSSSKIKAMSKIMSNRISTTMELVEKHAKLDEEFDIYENFQGLTLDVIADTALAMKVNCQTNLKDLLLVTSKNIMKLFNGKAIEYAVKFSFLTPIFMFLGQYMAPGRMISAVSSNIQEQIDYRRSNPGNRKSDLLQVMLESSDGDFTDSSRKSKVRLTDDELTANALLFLFAGFETTSVALAFTFWHLIKNPDIQEKLYHEITDVYPEQELTYDSIQNIEYLDQVFNESLRLHPPVTGLINRMCAEEYKVGDLTIPEGVIVYAPVWDIHRDPDLWSNPTQFDPDRFSRENKSSINNMAFMPFGMGPRNCIGMRFAQLEAKLAIAELIRKFKFVRCDKTDDSLALVCPMVTINPTKGVFCKAVLRY